MKTAFEDVAVDTYHYMEDRQAVTVEHITYFKTNYTKLVCFTDGMGQEIAKLNVNPEIKSAKMVL